MDKRNELAREKQERKFMKGEEKYTRQFLEEEKVFLAAEEERKRKEEEEEEAAANEEDS